MRKQYRLIKETPELKVGAIFEESCDAGDQDFKCITLDKLKFPKDPTQDGVCHGRHVIMKQPQWFEEVCLVPVPKSKLKAVQKLIK